MKPILFLRADSADVFVAIKDEDSVLASREWQAGRELSTHLHKVILELCEASSIKLEDFKGIVVYEGPGSYTGLRISISVANALGYSLQIPVIGSSGEDWQKNAASQINVLKAFTPISPVYGGEVYTTTPKK